jgi:hypothetical protein
MAGSGPPPLDAILDSGANINLLPPSFESVVQNLVARNSFVILGDKSSIPTYASASYGILQHVIMCKTISPALISVSYLTNTLKLIVFYTHDRAFIVTQADESPGNTEASSMKTIASATLRSDMLFHIDDMTAFLRPSIHPTPTTPTALFTISNHPYTMKEIKYGGARVFIKSGRQYLTLLQWLHVRLGHANEALLRWIIDKNVVLGSGVTKDEISKLELGFCDTCFKSRMHALPIPSSISRKQYEIFEYLTADYLPFHKTVHGEVKSVSIRGYTGAVLIADKSSGKLFGYPVKRKSEWLSTLQQCIQEFGPGANPRSSKPRFLLTDYASESHSAAFTSFLQANQIQLLNSTPYKHEQNLIERYVQSILNILRATMIHNHAPVRYWCYGLAYSIHTYNLLCKQGITYSRNEAFSGEKADISACVPFYSRGWAYRTPEERALAPTRGTLKSLRDHAIQVIMLGYCNPFPIDDSSTAAPHIKNAYICLIPSTNKIMPRHDCLFNNSPASALTNYEVHSSNDADSSSTKDDDHDYDLLFGADKNNPNESSSSLEEDLPSIQEEDSPLDDVVLAEDTNEPTASQPEEVPPPPPRSSLRTPKPTSRYETYVNQRKSSRPQHEDPKDPHRKVFIDPAVAYVMRESFPEINVTGIDPSPNIPMPSIVPKNLTEALASPESIYWYIAWKTEMQRLTQRSTWTESTVPEGKTKVKSKYAFRVTRRTDGTLKFRCRLVACGYSQVFGQDYDETYAPTAKYRSLCVVLHLAALYGWIIDGIDVENAYLESPIDKEIYMSLPSEAYVDTETNKPVTVRLLRSLYGLKQAGELWYQLLNRLILSQQFTRLIHDNCIYIRRDTVNGVKDITIIVVYVDDVLFIGNNRSRIESSINDLSKEFTKLTGTTDITRYIGIDIERDYENHTIKLSQKPYIENYVTDNANDESPKSIPMSPSLNYGPKGDGSIPPIHDKVGQLRFLADRTRPDILTAVGMLGSSAAKPAPTHVKGVHQLSRYLKGTTDYAITLGGPDDLVLLFGYTDASHLPDNSSKPRLAYCFFLGRTSGTIHARSFSDSAVSHSSCESEIRAIDSAIKQAIWLRGLLEELGYPQSSPTILYTDSMSAKTLADSARINNNNCHLVLRINYIHECIQNKIIELKYITTENEVADVLTKLLPLPSHERHSSVLLRGHDGKLPDTRTRAEKPPSIKRFFHGPKKY